MKKLVVILGAGGCARELYWNYHDAAGGRSLPDVNFVFVDDVTERREVVTGGRTLPVVKDWDFRASLAGVKEAGFLCGISDPAGKKTMADKAKKAGLAPLPTLVHPKAFVQGIDGSLGKGGYIAPGCVLTVNVRLGDFVLLNYNTTVGHDAVIEDYVTLNPGCHISGNVVVGEGSMLGAGAFVLENLKLPKRTVAGAQSCIIRPAEREGATVVGVPSRTVK